MDARASMQLVLLKLRRGFAFGDVIINGCTSQLDEDGADDETNDWVGFDQVDFNSDESIRKFIYQTGINIEQNFFDALKRSDISSTYLSFVYVYIINELTHFNHFLFSIKDVYIDQNKRDSIDKKSFYLVDNNENAFNKLCECLNTVKFTWTQFYVDSEVYIF